MKIETTALPGVLVFTPTVYRDDRGAFFESYNQTAMVEAGLPSIWPQDNVSISRKNVLRGIHYQLVNPQGKLVRVTHGAVLDVAVDLRRGSPHFGRHVVVELTSDNCRMLWIPEGFGHAFLVLSERAGFAYKVTSLYTPANDRSIRWNDPVLAIPWPVAPTDLVLSAKDSQAPLLRDAQVYD